MSKSEEPGCLYWSLVEPHWLAMNISWDHGPDSFIHQFNAAPSGVGHMYAGHWCQSEVCNGGLEQFFYNTTGMLAPEALAAFRVIGVPIWSDILMEAMKFFGPKYPRERIERIARLTNDPERFRSLDDRFFDWLDRWSRIADEYAKRLIAEPNAASDGGRHGAV